MVGERLSTGLDLDFGCVPRDICLAVNRLSNNMTNSMIAAGGTQIGVLGALWARQGAAMVHLGQ